MAADKDLAFSMAKTALEMIAEAYADIGGEEEEQEQSVNEEQKQGKISYYSGATQDKKLRQIGMDNYAYAMLNDLQTADARTLKHLIQSMSSYDYMMFLAYVRPAVLGNCSSKSEGAAVEHPFAEFVRSLPDARGSLDGRKLLATKAPPEIIRALIASALTLMKTTAETTNTAHKPFSWMREDLKCPECPKFFQRPCRLRLHQQRKHRMMQ